MIVDYRKIALEYVVAYRQTVGEEQIEMLLLRLSEEDLAVLEELLIFAFEEHNNA